MATPYTEVYDFFLGKVTDYNFIDTDIYTSEAELHEELWVYLRSAILRFPQSKVDLSDRSTSQFNRDLNDFEKEILATLMVINYLTPKIVSTQNMDMHMSDREFKMYSQAKQLTEMMKLKSEMQLEASQLISTYTYKDGLLDLR